LLVKDLRKLRIGLALHVVQLSHDLLEATKLNPILSFFVTP
jgi:hypothetical protein